nr:probable leucine-rich repeat receptor-like protein kinase At1g35710 [Tanacetum cinerariifolium]
MDIDLLLFIIILIISPLTSQACQPIDHQALLEFKHKITYDHAGLLQTWTPQTDCCKSWDGVACGPHGRVVNISRSGFFTTKEYDIVDTTMSDTISPYLSNPMLQNK